jgi:hypothetical protein
MLKQKLARYKVLAPLLTAKPIGRSMVAVRNGVVPKR